MDAGRVCPGTSAPHPIPANTARCRGRAHILPIQEDEIMKKRLLSLVLSLAMVLTMLPATVWAEDTVTIPAAVDTEITAVSGMETDGDALLMGYLYQLAGLAPEPAAEEPRSGIVSYPAMNTVALSETNQAAYEVLRDRVTSVAAEGGSTVFFVPVAPKSETFSYAQYAALIKDNYNGVSVGSDSYSYKEYYEKFYVNENRTLDDFVCDMAAYSRYASAYDLSAAANSFNANFDLGVVLNMLLTQLPFELYWFDKTLGAASGTQYRFEMTRDGDDFTVQYGIDLYFGVSQNYWKEASGYNIKGKFFVVNVDPAKAQSAAAAVTAAQGIVSDNADKNDWDKLRSYLDAVCSRVTYNSAAANKNTNTPYGDPWQLIYVFDGDPNTNVVCEGYAKAFKFLCDLSQWQEKSVRCSVVTGVMAGGNGAGNHMWNLVHLRDGNYLVDLTNCDQGTSGAPDKLFMREWEAGAYDGTYSFTNPSITYTYDDDTKATYTPEELKLKGDPTLPAQQPRLMWRNNHYDWDGENRITTYELWDEVNVSRGQVIEGQFVFGTEDDYVSLDAEKDLTYDGLMVLQSREEETQDLALEAVAFGTMTVTYQHEDEAYTLPVTVGLPDVGFYSQPTASENNYLTEWRYDGSNTVYLVWPQGATDVTILPDEHSRTKATATMADGYATITITDLQEDDVAFEMSYQLSGNEVRTHAHLRVVDVRPGLGFYQARNGESGFARENGAALNRSFGTVGKGSHREVQFVITGEEETIVSLSNLTYDKDYIEIIDRGNNCVELAFNKFGDTTLSVTVGETTYTMPITIGLPTLGFYSSPEATEDTYLNEWIYTGEDAVIYLICQNGTLTEVTGADDNASGVSATILEGGKAAEIRLTKLPEGHLDVRAAYTRDDGVPDHGDAGVGFLMPRLVVDLSLPEGVSDAAVILWDKEGAALEPQPEMRRIGSMAVFPNVDPGEYRLTVEQQGCATRTYAIAVAQGKVTVVDAVVTALGDLNGSGKTDISDMACLYDWLYLGEYTGALAAERDYFRAVADVNNDGLVNILDYQALYEIVKAQ